SDTGACRAGGRLKPLRRRQPGSLTFAVEVAGAIDVADNTAIAQRQPANKVCMALNDGAAAAVTGQRGQFGVQLSLETHRVARLIAQLRNHDGVVYQLGGDCANSGGLEPRHIAEGDENGISRNGGDSGS